MFGDAYTPDFQRYGHCLDLLAREAFQKLVSVDECDSAAGVKTSRDVGVKALWQVPRGKRDGCNCVGLALESEARA